jgi:hypothetical protein
LAERKAAQAIADARAAAITVDKLKAVAASVSPEIPSNGQSPNTSIITARLVTEGATVNGSITTAEERHFFKFIARGEEQGLSYGSVL